MSVTRHVRDLEQYSFDYFAGPPPPLPPAFTVSRGDGPIVRPATPRCAWIDACCAQLAQSVVGAMTCAMVPAAGATDCTEADVEMVARMASEGGGGTPPACMR